MKPYSPTFEALKIAVQYLAFDIGSAHYMRLHPNDCWERSEYGRGYAQGKQLTALGNFRSVWRNCSPELRRRLRADVVQWIANGRQDGIRRAA